DTHTTPQPAWPGRDTRMPLDRAYHTVTAGATCFFGSSADCGIHARPIAPGGVQWTFFTDAPVRFAPVVWKDRVLAASDDGYLYCLSATDGKLLWKCRGGPEDDMLLGNGRMISRWPARGGPVVVDGIVYFAAGIWTAEGIFVYALDVTDGRVLWCNDTAGAMDMPQPHGGANAKSGISAQGYLTVVGDVLLVPTGRGVPAALNRADGKFRYFHLQANRGAGGSEITAGDDFFLNGRAAFSAANGGTRAGVPAVLPGLVAITPEQFVAWIGGSVKGFVWEEIEKPDRQGKPVKVRVLAEKWSVPVPFGGTSLIVAGGTVVSAGKEAGSGHGVCTVDLATKKVAWSAPVDGVPWGLSAGDGRLLVSTDQGRIHVFGPKQQVTPMVEPLPTDPAGRPPDKAVVILRAAIEEITTESNVEDGYCIDLGCGDGWLADSLARVTGMHIIAIDPDPKNVAAARKRLSEAGLYGTRVTVLQGDPAATNFPNYAANLIVSGRSLTEDIPAAWLTEADRVLRPFGGIRMTGQPGEMTKVVRGPLEGAGNWTHQYCDPANTACSTDTRVRGPLGMLWFADFDFQMPSRHGRGPAPLLLDGRMFIQGVDALRAVDAYNGRLLWEYPLPGILKAFDGEHLMGTSGTGGNYCVSPEGLYIRTGGTCLRIDPASGRLLARLNAPPQPDGKPGTWGLVVRSGDLLLGTLVDTEHKVTYRFGRGDMSTQFTESLLLFALDAATGELRWTYRPEHSIRHNTVAVGSGHVYLIDRPQALGDRVKDTRGAPPHPDGTLVALGLTDGKLAWKNDENIYGTMLALSEQHKTLLMCYQDWRFKLASEAGGHMAAFDSATGSRRWDVAAKYATRPIINGQTIYMQPGAWDLLTGKPTGFTFERSYGCGILAGSKHLLTYRSATLGYTDLTRDVGTESYGPVRPGCWINTLPAGGLVLMPDATDRCTCSYLIKSSVALQPLSPGER
ncbi:MAG: PQQ-binding-like beta-propeller repeat protein, partial [Planctomycetes bacterium]|nr:PQQ-binding-like beta-propeller repeat protein [Planctomycetota bacterium]